MHCQRQRLSCQVSYLSYCAEAWTAKGLRQILHLTVTFLATLLLMALSKRSVSSSAVSPQFPLIFWITILYFDNPSTFRFHKFKPYSSWSHSLELFLWMPYLFFFLYVKVMSLTIQAAEGLLQLSCVLCIPCIHLPCQHHHHQLLYEHFDQSIIRLLQHDHRYEVSAVQNLSRAMKFPDPVTIIRAFK